MGQDTTIPPVPTSIVALTLIYTVVGPLGLIPAIVGILVLVTVESLHIFNDTVDDYRAVKDEQERQHRAQQIEEIVSIIERRLVSKQQQAVDDFEARTTRLNDSHQVELDDISKKAASLEEDIVEHDDEIFGLQNDNDSLTARITAAESNAATSNAKLQALQDEYDKKISTLQSSQSTTEADLLATQNERKILKARVSSLEESMSDVTEDLRELLDDDQKLKDKIAKLEKTENLHRNDVVTLRHENQKLSKKINDMAMDTVALRIQVLGFKSEVKETPGEKATARHVPASTGVAGTSTTTKQAPVAPTAESFYAFNMLSPSALYTGFGAAVFEFPTAHLAQLNPVSSTYKCVGTNLRSDRCGWYSIKEYGNPDGFEPQQKQEALTILNKMRSNNPGDTLELKSLRVLASKLLCPKNHGPRGSHCQVEAVSSRWFADFAPARLALQQRDIKSPASGLSTPPATPERW